MSERLSKRKIREVLRLAQAGRSQRESAIAVWDQLQRAKAAHVTWCSRARQLRRQVAICVTSRDGLEDCRATVTIAVFLGVVREVELFLMVMGASNYTFAEASPSQKASRLRWLDETGFEYFGCVPQGIVPDQLRSAIRGTDRYEPDIYRTPGLLGELELARAAGEYASLLGKLSRVDVLVLDDFLPNPMTETETS